MKFEQHIYLDQGLAEQLAALAAKPGTTKSAIVAKALEDYLTRTRSTEIEPALKTRLDHSSRTLNRILREQQVVLETLGLFIRYMLTVMPPLPDSEQAAARALGQERFNALIEQVGRRLSQGKSLSSGLPEQSREGES